MSSLILSLALENHNENELETICPPPNMQQHIGGEPYAYVLHTGSGIRNSHPFAVYEIFQIS